MGIGASLFLATVGAILAFAVEVSIDVFDVQAAGIILMITGALGLVLSLIYWDSWWGAGRRPRSDGRHEDLQVHAHEVHPGGGLKWGSCL